MKKNTAIFESSCKIRSRIRLAAQRLIRAWFTHIYFLRRSEDAPFAFSKTKPIALCRDAQGVSGVLSFRIRFLYDLVIRVAEVLRGRAISLLYVCARWCPCHLIKQKPCESRNEICLPVTRYTRPKRGIQYLDVSNSHNNKRARA